MDIPRDTMYLKFRLYGFLKNLRFFDPFIVLFFREMGMSFLAIGSLFAIREIATNILEIPTGFIADSIGRRKAMIASFSSYLVAFAIFYFFPDFWIYAFAMVLYASGEAFRSGTHKAMILEYLRIKKMEHMKVDYYGHTRSASQFGSAISSLIAMALVFYYGSYRIVFLASMIPYVMELFLMISYPKYLDGEIRKKGSMKEAFASTWKEFLSMFRNRESLRAISNSALFDSMFKSSKDYLQPILEAQAIALPVLLYMTGQERTAILVGTTYFFLYLITSWASRSAGSFSRRFGRSAINLTFLLGIALLMGAGLFTHLLIYPAAVILFIAFYALQNLRRPVMVAYISDNIPHRTMASGLSVESQIKMTVVAIAAPVLGYMADTMGVGSALAVFASFFILVFLSVRLPRSASDKRPEV